MIITNGVPEILLEEWDSELNSVRPEDARGSQKYWWKCSQSEHRHSYQTQLNSKHVLRGCPYCAGKKALVGYNDAASAAPKLIKEWSALNEKPLESYVKGSSKKGIWECANGHQWEAQIKTRVDGARCGKCVIKSSLSDETKENIEKLREEWDLTKKRRNR